MDWDKVSVACLLHSCCIFIHCWATSPPNLPINYPGKPSEWQSPVCHSQRACLLFHTVNNLVSQCPNWGKLWHCGVQHNNCSKCASLRLSLPNNHGLIDCVSETSRSLYKMAIRALYKSLALRPLLSKPNENQIQLNGNDPGSESDLTEILGQVNEAWHVLAQASLSG